MRIRFSPRITAGVLLLAGGLWLGRASFTPKIPTTRPAMSVAAPARAQAEPVWDEASLLELSEADPLKAISLAKRFLDGVVLDRVIAVGLEKLLNEDPAVAAGIVAALPAGDFQQIAAGRVARALAQTRPAEALAWAQSLTDDAVRLRAARETFARWGETDPVTACGWISTLGSERERGLAALALVTTWVRSDAPAALAWSQTLSSAETRALLLPSAMQTWAARDAEAAMLWMAAQPADLMKVIEPSAMQAMLVHWPRQDATAAKDFVDSLPATQQPRIVEAMAPQLAQADPVSTMLWALSFENTTLGEATFATAFRHWRDLAPVGAQQWLKAAELTPDEKARLIDYP